MHPLLTQMTDLIMASSSSPGPLLVSITGPDMTSLDPETYEPIN